MKNLELGCMNAHNLSCENVTYFGLNASKYFYLRGNKLYSYDPIQDRETRLCEEIFNDVVSFEVLRFENMIAIGSGTFVKLYSLDATSSRSFCVNLEKQVDALMFDGLQESIAVMFCDGFISIYTPNFNSKEFHRQGCTHVYDQVQPSVRLDWGSTETQFRGIRGKCLEERSESTIEPIVDLKPRITWRGNSSMFAVNYYLDGKRYFKVYDLYCRPLFGIEDTDGLQAPIAWKPQGNMIACSYNVDNLNTIAVFEKNGIERFTFPLMIEQETVVEISWSPCAEVLAVQQNLRDGGSSLSLFTVRNYKWYLKQQLLFKKANNLKHFLWSTAMTDFSKTLIAVTDQNIISYVFKSDVHRSPNSEHCAVIDGSSLLITMFDDSVVSPPMSTVRFNATAPINFVCFHNTRRLCATISSDYVINIVGYDNKEVTSQHTVKMDSVILLSKCFPLVFHKFYWVKEDLYCVTNNLNDADFLLFKVSWNTNGDITVVQNLLDVVSEPALTPLLMAKKKLSLRDMLPDAELQQYQLILANYTFKFVGNVRYNFILTFDNKFYINRRKISEEVTSFVFRDDYLLLTVYGRLFCVRLSKLQIDLLFHHGLCPKKFYSRSVEQGAIIICAKQSTPDVVMQMPRGNIETVYCYLIAIDTLEELLEAKKWEDALYFMRMLKLDWNLLIDLDPQRFIKHVKDIINTCNNPNILNAIVSEIRDENVLTTKYSQWLVDKVYEPFENKRNVICEEILGQLQEQDYSTAMNSVIFICIHVFSLQRGLRYLQDLLTRIEGNPNLQKVAVDCVKLLKSYVTDENLFKQALLIYDLNLADYIASFTSIDPKIYKRQLEFFASFNEMHRRFEINLYLYRYTDAVTYLLRIPNLRAEEVTNFIKGHKVCEAAYKACPKNSPYYQAVASTYADSLSTNGHHNEAGILLYKANMYELAITKFMLAGNWKQIVKIIHILKYDEVKRTTILQCLAFQLISKNPLESALIYNEYLQQYEKAIGVLVEGKYFSEAMRLAEKYNLTDKIDSMILDPLNEYCKEIKMQGKRLREVFDFYKNRLKIVRLELQKQLDENDCEYQHCSVQDSELYSEGGTSISGSHLSQTSRRKKKEERKMQDLREGGKYEDIALIKTIYSIYKDIITLSIEVKNLCTTLLEDSDVCLEDIEAMYDMLHDQRRVMIDSIEEIWPKFFTVDNPTKVKAERAILKNIQFLDEEYRRPPEMNSSHFTVSLFSK